MQIRVENIRGIQYLEHKLHTRLTLIAGPNSSGKSSVAYAIALALVGLDAISGRSAKSALLRQGAKHAVVQISNAFGSRRINIPGDIKITGKPMAAHPVAVGIVDPLTLGKSDRFAMLSRLPGAEPELDYMIEAAKRSGGKQAATMLIEAWREHENWDACSDTFAAEARVLKRQWEKLTGERWGKDKASVWQPDLPSDLDQNGIDAQIATLSARLNGVYTGPPADEIANQAAVIEQQIQATQKALEEATAARDALPEKIPSQIVELHCPHCGAICVFKDGRLAIPDETSVQDVGDLRRQIVDAENAKSEHRGRLTVLSRRKAELEKNLEDARNAGERLSQADRDRIRGEMHHLTQCKRLMLAVEEARQVNEQIMLCASLASLTGPTGPRREARQVMFSALASKIKAHATAMGLPGCHMDDDMEPTLEGRPASFLSASERAIMRTAYQIAIAELTGSDMVVVDNVEAITRKRFAGILKHLRDCAIPAVVTMACEAGSAPSIPDGTVIVMDG